MDDFFVVVVRLKSAFTFFYHFLVHQYEYLSMMQLNYCSWKANDSKRFLWTSARMMREIPMLQKA